MTGLGRPPQFYPSFGFLPSSSSQDSLLPDLFPSSSSQNSPHFTFSSYFKTSVTEDSPHFHFFFVSRHHLRRIPFIFFMSQDIIYGKFHSLYLFFMTSFRVDSIHFTFSHVPFFMSHDIIKAVFTPWHYLWKVPLISTLFSVFFPPSSPQDSPHLIHSFYPFFMTQDIIYEIFTPWHHLWKVPLLLTLLSDFFPSSSSQDSPHLTFFLMSQDIIYGRFPSFYPFLPFLHVTRHHLLFSSCFKT